MLIRESPTVDAARLRRAGAACPGSVELFLRDDGAGSLIVCGADEAAPADTFTDKRVEIRFARGRHGSAGGEWLFHVGMWTPSDFRDEFLAWYEIEHLPILLECPSWDGCRFAEEKAERGARFHSLHQLSDRAALDSAERKYARSTPWFKRLSGNDWFDGAFTRTLCRRIAA